jgi:hypothetical protein
MVDRQRAGVGWIPDGLFWRDPIFFLPSREFLSDVPIGDRR